MLQLPSIKCYTGTVTHYPNTFYVLNKGENSGRPINQPCQNCFCVHCETPQELEFWFWLCWALHQTARFRPYLYGSVIPFLRIGDFKAILFAASQARENKTEAFDKGIKTLRELDAYELALKQKIALVGQLKHSIAAKCL